MNSLAFPQQPPIDSVAFSPDNKLFAAGSKDGITQIVTVEGGHVIARVVQDGAVSAVAFSRDGKLFATASSDRTVRLWSTDFDNMLHWLCAAPGRNLSRVEWRRYLGDLPWQPTCEQWPTPKD